MKVRSLLKLFIIWGLCVSTVSFSHADTGTNLPETTVTWVQCSGKTTQSDCNSYSECNRSSNTCKRKCEVIPDKESCEAPMFSCAWKGGKCTSCKGIQLNTNVPFIWRCISLSNNDQINAFPTLIWALMRILTSAMLIVGFMMILIAGVMMTTGGASPNNYKTGKEMIFKVWAALALLGSLGVILKLINPTFFT